jgi:hypothetical protein
VDVLRVTGHVRPLGRRTQQPDQGWFELDGAGDRPQVLVVPPVEVDPEELAIADLPRQPVLDRDLAIPTVRVVEPDAQSDGRPVADAQRTAASSTATAMASTAVPYWKTSMA